MRQLCHPHPIWKNGPHGGQGNYVTGFIGLNGIGMWLAVGRWTYGMAKKPARMRILNSAAFEKTAVFYGKIE